MKPADFGSAAYSCQSCWYLGLRRRNSQAQIRPIPFFESGYCVKSCQLGSQSSLFVEFLSLDIYQCFPQKSITMDAKLLQDRGATEQPPHWAPRARPEQRQSTMKAGRQLQLMLHQDGECSGWSWYPLRVRAKQQLSAQCTPGPMLSKRRHASTRAESNEAGGIALRCEPRL